jgi:hypothetical protein
VSQCLVDSEFINDTAFSTGLHCDKGGRSHHSMHACAEYGWECSTVELTALVMPYQSSVLKNFGGMPWLKRPGNGEHYHLPVAAAPSIFFIS